MKVVVTGATGFLGKWLVEELLRRGDEVLAIVRDISKIPISWSDSKKLKIIKCALSDYNELLQDETFIMNADVFFHFAWQGTSGISRTDIDMQLENARASCVAVHLAKKMRCKRFVHAGSIMEYEAIKNFTIDGFAPGMSCIYSIAKTMSDYLARTVAVQEGLEYINLIIANIYGVRESSARFVNTMLKRMIAGEQLLLTDGKQKYDFIYVSDAVRAILLVAEKGKNLENYYIGNSEQKLLKDYVLSMHKVVGSMSELRFGEIERHSKSLEYDEFDVNKLERELGFKSEISFEQGIKYLSEWIMMEDNDE